MSKSSLRPIIIVLTLVTAFVHLVLLNLEIMADKGSIDILFTLNGLGYLGLLGALLFDFPAGRERLVAYALIGFTLVTILAWVAIGARTTLGYVTKLDEVLLVIFLWMYTRRSE